MDPSPAPWLTSCKQPRSRRCGMPSTDSFGRRVSRSFLQCAAPMPRRTSPASSRRTDPRRGSKILQISCSFSAREGASRSCPLVRSLSSTTSSASSTATTSTVPSRVPSITRRRMFPTSTGLRTPPAACSSTSRCRSRSDSRSSRRLATAFRSSRHATAVRWTFIAHCAMERSSSRATSRRLARRSWASSQTATSGTSARGAAWRRFTSTAGSHTARSTSMPW
mmetsp:Transcript_8379/g.22341  ORF Transcript_8379/g.22341 Transcript_8379/m.22341 type:complete len:223 (-) Transcript_8379:76-744(-)